MNAQDEARIAVTVIVAFRDAEKTLGRCLQAVCQQRLEGVRVEVLAVDNGSRDRSPQIAQRAAAEHAHLRVLFEPRPGAYIARNRGVAEARGDVIVFTDADCIPVDDWLRCLVRAVQQPGARVVMGRDRPAGPGRGVRLLGAYDHCKEVLVLGGSEPQFYYGHTNNLATTRATLRAVGGFDPRPRGADVIFVHQVLQRHGTESVRYEPAAHVEHLEIETVWIYFRKATLYGRSARRYCDVVAARPLTARLRWRSFRHTVESHDFGVFDRFLLLGLLALGAVAYQWGWLAERWTKESRESADGSSDSTGVESVRTKTTSSQDTPR